LSTGKLLNTDELTLQKIPSGLLERQNQEINNGRLAMIATAGILAQEAVTGQPQG